MILARVADRFGWTFSQLDEEDEGRTIKAISMMNIADSLTRVHSNIESHHADKISSGDAAIYKLLVEARKEEAAESDD